MQWDQRREQGGVPVYARLLIDRNMFFNRGGQGAACAQGSLRGDLSMAFDLVLDEKSYNSPDLGGGLGHATTK